MSVSREFRVDVARVEWPEPSCGRVHLEFTLPAEIEATMVRRELATQYACRLGESVGMRVRRVPWGDGIRVAQAEAGLALDLRGLEAAAEVQLERLAREAAERCNRDIGPDGAIGIRLRRVLDRLAS